MGYGFPAWALLQSFLAMPNAVMTEASETTTSWEFALGGYLLTCQQTESSQGTHTILVTENDVVIERHVIREDPANPGDSARRLNEVRAALRGIYQSRFIRASSSRRK